MSSTLTPPTSSTTTTSSNNTGIAAHVNFRVRCETLGHGEDVYLVRSQSDSKNTTGNDDTTSTSTFSMQKVRYDSMAAATQANEKEEEEGGLID